MYPSDLTKLLVQASNDPVFARLSEVFARGLRQPVKVFRLTMQ